MHANQIWLSIISALLLVCLGSACRTREVGTVDVVSPDDAAPDTSPAADGPTVDAGQDAQDAADGPTADAAPPMPKVPVPQGKPIGSPCAGSADCVSGFCADGVCCSTPCDAPCYACNQAGGMGSCEALGGIDDLSGASPCTGASVCAIDSSGAAACKLRDGQECRSSGECAGGACRTYFRDADGDGFGAIGSPATFSRCDTTPNPPSGFTTTGGDCCDTDPGANPAVVAYFTVRDRCGNFDWNCRGGEEREGARTCPTAGNQPIGCGQICSLVFKGTPTTLYVQACR